MGEGTGHGSGMSGSNHLLSLETPILIFSEMELTENRKGVIPPSLLFMLSRGSQGTRVPGKSQGQGIPSQLPREHVVSGAPVKTVCISIGTYTKGL